MCIYVHNAYSYTITLLYMCAGNILSAKIHEIKTERIHIKTFITRWFEIAEQYYRIGCCK